MKVAAAMVAWNYVFNAHEIDGKIRNIITTFSKTNINIKKKGKTYGTRIRSKYCN